jgi:hypothetical protein
MREELSAALMDDIPPIAHGMIQFYMLKNTDITTIHYKLLKK